MILRFIEVENRATKPKATIHITGKLGFNKEAARYMGMTEHTYYRIALDETFTTFRNLYLVESNAETKGAIKVAKAGNYFYLNVTSVFDEHEVQYGKYVIIFDIDKGDYEGSKLFTLKRRKKDIPRKSEDKESAD